MIGRLRLENLQYCIETVLAEEIKATSLRPVSGVVALAFSRMAF